MNNLETSLNETSKAVEDLMNIDLFDMQKRTTIIKALNICLKSKDYINQIKLLVNAIKLDGKFDMNDLPSIFSIVLQSKTFLNTIIIDGMSIKTNFDTDSFKYIVYGILYYIMLIQNVDKTVITQLSLTYNSLWTLVAFDPKKLFIKAESCFKSLSCYKPSCCKPACCKK
jgi:hypothetical protein